MKEELIEAIKHDSLVGVSKLLEGREVDLNEIEIVCDEYDIDDPDEVPLLFWTIRMGVSVEMIELLISYGLDLSWTNREGLGAIDVAIKAKRKDIIELCGRHGMSYTQTKRRSGMTPLMVAASFGNRELVDFFLAYGADPREKDKRGSDAIEYARMLGYATLSEYLAGFMSEE